MSAGSGTARTAADTSLMSINLLGRLETSYGTVPGADHKRAVLAYLATRANRMVPYHELLEELWGYGQPKSALSNLQGYILSLRREFGFRERIVQVRNGYLLKDVDVDAERLRCLLNNVYGLLEEERMVEAREVAVSALALANRGEPLEDVRHGLWLEREVVRIARSCADVVQLWSLVEMLLGFHGRVVSQLHELWLRSCGSEQLAALYMLALYRSGRRAEAMGVFQTTQNYLIHELGLDPSPSGSKLFEIYKKVQNQDLELMTVGDPQLELKRMRRLLNI